MAHSSTPNEVLDIYPKIVDTTCDLDGRCALKHQRQLYLVWFINVVVCDNPHFPWDLVKREYPEEVDYWDNMRRHVLPSALQTERYYTAKLCMYNDPLVCLSAICLRLAPKKLGERGLRSHRWVERNFQSWNKLIFDYRNLLKNKQRGIRKSDPWRASPIYSDIVKCEPPKCNMYPYFYCHFHNELTD